MALSQVRCEAVASTKVSQVCDVTSECFRLFCHQSACASLVTSHPCAVRLQPHVGAGLGLEFQTFIVCNQRKPATNEGTASVPSSLSSSSSYSFFLILLKRGVNSSIADKRADVRFLFVRQANAFLTFSVINGL